MRTIKTILLFVAISASLATLSLMIYTGQGWKQGISWWLGFTAFGVWAISPYVFLVIMISVVLDTLKQSICFLIGSLAVILVAMIVYYDGFFVHSDAQSALLLVFLPVYQWAGSGVIVGLVKLIDRKKQIVSRK